MSQVSSKCDYALRAIYALAEHDRAQPLKIAAIAQREQIPIRFLEVILAQLKTGGFVQSRRGAEGGYLLAKPPEEITVGAVLRFVDGPIAPVDCVSPSRPATLAFDGHCAFSPFWERVRRALSDVVDQTTFADLVRENQGRRANAPDPVNDWVI